jgi:hypothetical protein
MYCICLISLPSIGKYKLAHARPVMWRLPSILCVVQNSSVRIRNVFCSTMCSFGMLTQSVRHSEHFAGNLLKRFLRTGMQNTGKLPKVQCWTERKYRNVIFNWSGVSKSSTHRTIDFQKHAHINLCSRLEKKNACISGGCRWFEELVPNGFLDPKLCFSGIRHRSD